MSAAAHHTISPCAVVDAARYSHTYVLHTPGIVITAIVAMHMLLLSCQKLS